MDRIIEVKVKGNHLTQDNNVAGLQYEGNVTSLRIEFDEGWDNYAKTVVFYDAYGQNPVKRVLTTDLLEDITVSTRVYLCAIPPEPLMIDGMMSYVIEGYHDGKRQRAVEYKLKVLTSPKTDNAGQPVDPTPSQAEQIQAQIDAMIGAIQQVPVYAREATISEHNAEAWAEGGLLLPHDGEVVSQQMTDGAKGYAEQAEEYMEEAKQAQEAAEEAQTKAQEYSSKPPIIRGNTWWVWDSIIQDYKDTGTTANSLVVEADGLWGVNVIDGDLFLGYTGDETPPLRVVGDHLYYDLENFQLDLGKVVGESAYQIAVKYGYQGSESAWNDAVNEARVAAEAAQKAAEKARDEAQAFAGGDFLERSVYDPQGKRTDIFAEIEEKANASDVNQALDGKVEKSGDTMTGDLTLQPENVVGYSRIKKNATTEGDWGLQLQDNGDDGSFMGLTISAKSQKLEFKKKPAGAAEYTYPKIYSSDNPPSASEVGAVAKSGDTMTGSLTVETDYGQISVGPVGANRAILMKNADPTNDYGTIIRDTIGSDTVELKLNASEGSAKIATGGAEYDIYHAGNLDIEQLAASENVSKLVYEKITTSKTWTAPKAKNQLFKVFCVGAGGGGGGEYSSKSGGGGGGGGYVEIADLTIPEGTAISVVCGAGGAVATTGNTTSPTAGSAGGSTSFGSLLTASGGKGGGKGTSSTGGAGGAGGAGGGGGRSASGTGGKGGAGGTYGGGGGGGYGSTGGAGGAGGTYGGKGGSRYVEPTSAGVPFTDPIANILFDFSQIKTIQLGAISDGNGGFGSRGGDGAEMGGGGGGYCGNGGGWSDSQSNAYGGGGGGGYCGNGGDVHATSSYVNWNGAGGGGFFCKGGNSTAGGSFGGCGGGFFSDGGEGSSGNKGGNGGVLIMYFKED